MESINSSCSGHLSPRSKDYLRTRGLDVVSREDDSYATQGWLMVCAPSVAPYSTSTAATMLILSSSSYNTSAKCYGQSGSSSKQTPGMLEQGPGYSISKLRKFLHSFLHRVDRSDPIQVPTTQHATLDKTFYRFRPGWIDVLFNALFHFMHVWQLASSKTPASSVLWLDRNILCQFGLGLHYHPHALLGSKQHLSATTFDNPDAVSFRLTFPPHKRTLIPYAFPSFHLRTDTLLLLLPDLVYPGESMPMYNPLLLTSTASTTSPTPYPHLSDSITIPHNINTKLMQLSIDLHFPENFSVGARPNSNATTTITTTPSTARFRHRYTIWERFALAAMKPRSSRPRPVVIVLYLMRSLRPHRYHRPKEPCSPSGTRRTAWWSKGRYVVVADAHMYQAYYHVFQGGYEGIRSQHGFLQGRWRPSDLTMSSDTATMSGWISHATLPTTFLSRLAQSPLPTSSPLLGPLSHPSWLPSTSSPSLPSFSPTIQPQPSILAHLPFHLHCSKPGRWLSLVCELSSEAVSTIVGSAFRWCSLTGRGRLDLGLEIVGCRFGS